MLYLLLILNILTILIMLDLLRVIGSGESSKALEVISNIYKKIGYFLNKINGFHFHHEYIVIQFEIYENEAKRRLGISKKDRIRECRWVGCGHKQVMKRTCLSLNPSRYTEEWIDL